MESICGIIDCQGFYSKGEFLVRELAITTGNFVVMYMFDTGLEQKSMTSKDLNTNHFISKKLNGLSYRPGVLQEGRRKSSEVALAVADLYTAIHTTEKPKFGVKNTQLKTMLESLGIPFVDLSTEIPSLRKASMAYLKLDINHSCWYHSMAKEKSDDELIPMCAFRKSQYLWNWVQSKKRGNRMLSECDNFEYAI